mgnify:CR=1 FL=1|tara:strand:+ start:214 stop:444 length:231 start_codon:yes stop_codon:yes gene_type:complete
MRWLIGLLPKRYKDLLALGEQIISRLDTPEERAKAVAFGIQMLSPDSEGGVRVTITEWSKWGGKLGILKGRTKKNP